MTALTGLRIIERTGRVTGEYAAKLLADFGAEVIKVEPPEGSPTRRMGPFVDGESSLFRYLNTNKTCIVFPPDSPFFDQLLASADALIEDSPATSNQRDAYPHLVHCIITPFGQSAVKDWQMARPINVMNAGGWAWHTPSETAPDKPPLKGAGRFMSDYEAGLEAGLATAASLWRKRQTGQGQFIDISEVATQLSRIDCVLGRMLAGEQEPGPERTRYDMGGPGAVFSCADGHIFLVMTTKVHWHGLCALMGKPGWAGAFPEDWLEFHCTPDRVEAFRAQFRLWLATQRKDAVSEAAQKLGVALVQVNTAADLPNHPQYQHRGYFQTLAGETYPTVPYRMSASPVCLVTSAPQLGTNTSVIPIEVGRQRSPSPSGEGLGWGVWSSSTPEMSRALTAPTPIPSPEGEGLCATRPPQRGGPLSGIRVLEIAKVWAGPYAGKLLAFLGAEVIKVESHSNLDEMRAYGGVDIDSAPYFLSINQEVLSVQLDMKSDEGMALLHRMIAQSDILLDNLRPGAMERLGLGYDAVRAVKPDIIQLSIKMYGTDGPLGYQTGYAPCFAALGGLTAMVGHEGETPKGMNIRYGDSTVGASAAFAAVAALHHRARTGEGQFVDVSAVETMSSMVGDSLFAYGQTGEVPKADGNAHPEMDPHGCFPCADGQWISIAAANEAERQAIRDVLGEGPLDDATRSHDAETLAETLRAKGVPAFRSLNSLDLIADPFHWESGTYRNVTDARGIDRPIIGPGWRMDPDEAAITRGAPLLGEHNDYIYRDLLGLSADQLANLKARKVVD